MNRSLTIYGSFLIASLVVIATFLTTTTYVQLALAIILYSIVIYFGFRAFPRKARSIQPMKPVETPQIETAEAKKERLIIEDIDKRAFLKLFGGIGLSVLLFSLINKKVGGLIPGSTTTTSETTALIKDTTGKEIDPAQSQPTDGYRISEIDDSDVSFHGFINKDGAWFIMKGDTAGAFRYSRGDFNFPLSWTNRKNLKYDYYSNVFKTSP